MEATHSLGGVPPGWGEKECTTWELGWGVGEDAQQKTDPRANHPDPLRPTGASGKQKPTALKPGASPRPPQVRVLSRWGLLAPQARLAAALGEVGGRGEIGTGLVLRGGAPVAWLAPQPFFTGGETEARERSDCPRFRGSRASGCGYGSLWKEGRAAYFTFV